MGLKSRGWEATSANSPGHVTSLWPDRSRSTSPEVEPPAPLTKPFSKYSVLPPIGGVPVEQHARVEHVDDDGRRRTPIDFHEYDSDMYSSRIESDSMDSSDTTDNVSHGDSDRASTSADDDAPPAADITHSDNNRVLSFRRDSSGDCAPPPILFNRDYHPEPVYEKDTDSNDSNCPSGREKSGSSTASEFTDSSTDDEECDRGCESEPAYQTRDLYESTLRYPEERIYLSQSRNPTINDGGREAQSKCSFCREAELDCHCGEETDGSESSVERFLAEYRQEQEKKYSDKVEELTGSKVPVDRDGNHAQHRCSSEKKTMDTPYSTSNQNENESQHYFHEAQVDSQSTIAPEMIKASVEQYETEVSHSPRKHVEINPSHFDDSVKDKNTCNPSDHSTIHTKHLSKSQSLLRPYYVFDFLTNIDPMASHERSPTNPQTPEQLPLQHTSDRSPSRALQFTQDDQFYWEKELYDKRQVQGGSVNKKFKQPANDDGKDDVWQNYLERHDNAHDSGDQKDQEYMRNNEHKMSKNTQVNPKGSRHKKVRILRDSLKYSQGLHYQDRCQYDKSKYYTDDEDDTYQEDGGQDEDRDQHHIDTNLNQSHQYLNNGRVDGFKEHHSKTNLEQSHQGHKISRVDGYKEHPRKTILEQSQQYHHKSRVNGFKEHFSKTNLEQSHQYHEDSLVNEFKEQPSKTNLEQSHQNNDNSPADGFKEQPSKANLEQSHLYHYVDDQDAYKEHHTNTHKKEIHQYYDNSRVNGFKEHHSKTSLEQSHQYHEDSRVDGFKEHHSKTSLEQSHQYHEDSRVNGFKEHHSKTNLEQNHQYHDQDRYKEHHTNINKEQNHQYHEDSRVDGFQEQHHSNKILEQRLLYSKDGHQGEYEEQNSYTNLEQSHLYHEDRRKDEYEKQHQDETLPNDVHIDNRPIYHEGYMYYEYDGRYEDLFPQLGQEWDDMKLHHDHIESIVKPAAEYFHMQDYDDWKKEQHDCWAQVSQIPILNTDQMYERGDKTGILYLRQKVETPSSVDSDSGSDTSSVPSPIDEESNGTPSPDNRTTDSVFVSHQSTSNESPVLGLPSYPNPFSSRQPLPSIPRGNKSCLRESLLKEPYQHPMPNRLSREILPGIPPARKNSSSPPTSRSPSRQLPQRYPLQSTPTFKSGSSPHGGSPFHPRPPAAPRDSTKSRRVRSVRFNLDSSPSNER